ncbi:nucleotide pyrophosphohydrolase [Microbacterium Phage Clancy]|uniref:MazG-like nucleotide pyrophosphohydrolase n=5 Tax=Ilzatvirus ilzat TaxID=2560593 RepID=A0A515MKN3_9CAUD|nr:nucleotide pyrophosphohydrolase [Microbacterium phage Ilzat]QDM57184.1 MazG-like nucleotide pyrophosphohydrolase [Microbacterium phage HanSolo]QDM57716.1 nucleotide pyrophosphohydrolase [Microbacterium Phage Clancy]QGH71392.1 nucleotide pyrophosphohydrolase [Microbacterium phage Benjalauren]QJD49706.1 MazG-like nucleotide pyrophosphohydrolase [Microbacterium phage Sedgewig]USL89064.1 MazG-like nucleotide pyrophosphohydrolase [Microbacterium phage KannH]
MTTYQHNNPTVEAIRFTIDAAKEVAKWCGGRVINSASDGAWVMFTDVNGRSQTAVPSDYIVKYEQGKFARFTEPEFEAEYSTIGHTESRDYLLAKLQHLLNLPDWGHKAQRQNRDFHTAFGIKTPASPRAIPESDIPVVVELIREEFIDELIPALGFEAIFTEDGKFLHLNPVGEFNAVEVYDALIDILYVTYGALNRAGMDAEPGYDEVQGSNMSKLGEDGKPIIAGPNDPDGVFPGRVKKGPNYYKPNLARVLEQQGWKPDAEEQVA